MKGDFNFMLIFCDNKILIRNNNFEINFYDDLEFEIINTSKNLPNNWQNLTHWCDVKNLKNLKHDDELIALRDIWHRFGYEIFAKAGGAWQFANWFRSVKICSFCGEELEPGEKDFGRYCKKCGRVFYAPLSPAIIVAIERDGKLLLAHNKSMPEKRFSIIAGFVEPGEKLEDTVVREVREEVSIKVKNIKYFGSQPWPFPNSLMLGFTAEWESGELKPDGNEISEASWYSKKEILEMNIPDGASIARRLIDNFISAN